MYDDLVCNKVSAQNALTLSFLNAQSKSKIKFKKRQGSGESKIILTGVLLNCHSYNDAETPQHISKIHVSFKSQFFISLS
jgi:hypothetical protein